jgi:4-aminobutyrate aminotransferase-like enzyme
VTERIVAAARERGLLLYSSTGHVDGRDGDLVMFGAPLILSDDERAFAVQTTCEALAAALG